MKEVTMATVTIVPTAGRCVWSSPVDVDVPHHYVHDQPEGHAAQEGVDDSADRRGRVWPTPSALLPW